MLPSSGPWTSCPLSMVPWLSCHVVAWDIIGRLPRQSLGHMVLGEDGGYQWITHHNMLLVGSTVDCCVQTCIVPQILVSVARVFHHCVCVVYIGSLFLTVYCWIHTNLQWEVTFSFPGLHVLPIPHAIFLVRAIWDIIGIMLWFVFCVGLTFFFNIFIFVVFVFFPSFSMDASSNSSFSYSSVEFIDSSV